MDSVVLPDFTGQPVNVGIDFCRKHGLVSPWVEYVPMEDTNSDENYILEMHPGPGTAIRPDHQVLFAVPKIEISPFQTFQDEQVSLSSSTLSVSQYLDIDLVFDEDWKILVLKFFINHFYATRFQLLYYLKLHQLERDKPLERLLSRCLALNILIRCDIQNEHRCSVRAYTLNPYVVKKCRGRVDDRVVPYNVLYYFGDSATIKSALSVNQAYLYLLTQYQGVPDVRYYSEFVQYVRPATAEKGFAKIHLCCALQRRALLLFESVRDYAVLEIWPKTETVSVLGRLLCRSLRKPFLPLAVSGVWFPLVCSASGNHGTLPQGTYPFRSAIYLSRYIPVSDD